MGDCATSARAIDAHGEITVRGVTGDRAVGTAAINPVLDIADCDAFLNCGVVTDYDSKFVTVSVNVRDRGSIPQIETIQETGDRAILDCRTVTGGNCSYSC